MLKHNFSSPQQNITILTTNRDETLADALQQLPADTTPVFAEQVHEARIAVVNTSSDQPHAGADGLITNNPKLSPVIRHADCLPIMFWHESGVFGALHAGRKSTVAGIVANALDLLKSEFAIKENVQFWFGPVICKQCFQVDRGTDDHFDLVIENSSQIAEWFAQRTYTLTNYGVCTRCHSDRFYSYRGDGPGNPMNYTTIAVQLLQT